MTQIMHFPIAVTDVDEDVRHLLPLIKPDWPVNDIKIESIKGGFSCHMRRYSCPSVSKNAVTIRVRHLFEKSSLNDPQFELRVIQILNIKREFPKIHATFNNGYIYDYVIGTPIVTLPLRHAISLDQDLLKSIANRLAKIHRIPLNGLSTQSYFDTLRELMRDTFEPVTNILPNKEELHRELNLIENYIKKNIPTSKQVLTHGDFHAFNIIKLHDGSVKFFDWEFAHVNHRAYDIAFFFQVLTTIGYANEIDIDIPEGAEKTFIKNYASVFDKASDFTSLYGEVQVYKLVVLIMLMVTQSVCHGLAKKVTKNPEKYHTKLLKEFFTRKQEVFGRNCLERG